MRVLISGASGLIGTALSARLVADGHQVSPLVRRPARGHDEVQWDPSAERLDPGAMENVDAVVNLSGAGIGDRLWTRSYVEELYASRLRSTRTLVTAMHAAATPPKVFLSQSGSHYYGDGGDAVLTEASESGNLLLSDICRKWEAEAALAPAGTRTVMMRTGVVMTAHGGALSKLLLPLRLGFGGPLGTGCQWWSWISLPDAVSAMTFLLDSALAGPVNLCAPEPARLEDIVRTLADRLHRPAALKVPARVLTATLGSLARELVLTSARVQPAVLTGAGFRWTHPDLPAVADWIASGGR